MSENFRDQPGRGALFTELNKQHMSLNQDQLSEEEKARCENLPDFTGNLYLTDAETIYDITFRTPSGTVTIPAGSRVTSKAALAIAAYVKETPKGQLLKLKSKRWYYPEKPQTEVAV